VTLRVSQRIGCCRSQRSVETFCWISDGAVAGWVRTARGSQNPLYVRFSGYWIYSEGWTTNDRDRVSIDNGPLNSVEYIICAPRIWILWILNQSLALRLKGFSIWGELKFLSNWWIFRITTNNCESTSLHFSAIFYELALMLSNYYLEHPKSKKRTEWDARGADFVFEKFVIFSIHDFGSSPWRWMGLGSGLSATKSYFQSPNHCLADVSVTSPPPSSILTRYTDIYLAVSYRAHRFLLLGVQP
jgi:hypothetical protein